MLHIVSVGKDTFMLLNGEIMQVLGKSVLVVVGTADNEDEFVKWLRDNKKYLAGTK